MKNSEIAEGVIEVLETRGWIKGSFHEPDEGFCVIGAALVTLGVPVRCLLFNELPTEYESHESRAREVLNPGLTVSSCAIWAFNGAESTTKEGVLDLATKAAKHWRDKGE